MNLYQQLNSGVFCLTIAALLTAIARDPVPLEQRPLAIWLFVAFFFFLRLKMWLDDHKYFGQAKTKNPWFKIGFLVGCVSWFMWGMCAWCVSSLQSAYFLAGIAISISTLWIVAAAVRRGSAYREQFVWIATNAVFVILLWEVHRRNRPKGDWITWAVLSLQLVIVLLDMFFSKSIPELDG